MLKGGETMRRGITASIALAAFVSLSSVALADDTTTPNATGGNDQVAVKKAAPTTNPIGSINSKSSTDPQKVDRDFHPDYSHAIAPSQMDAAWNAEIERVFQPPHAGGG
jgi:hypothetical protein